MVTRYRPHVSSTPLQPTLRFGQLVLACPSQARLRDILPVMYEVRQALYGLMQLKIWSDAA